MIWTAFIVGLLGSLHCVGMCGPIALAMPFQTQNRWQTTGNILLYNSGRILTYSLLGTLIGFLGQTIALAGLQIYFSLGLGVLMLVVAVFSINIESHMQRIPLLFRLNTWVKERMAVLLRKEKLKTLFSLGMLNGLLPCGLVYLAIVGAVATANVWQGALYMALFGAGTIPLLLSTALLGQFIPLKWRGQLKRMLPVLYLFFALLFIARGLNFEIPDQIRFWEIGNNVPMCH